MTYPTTVTDLMSELVATESFEQFFQVLSNILTDEWESQKYFCIAAAIKFNTRRSNYQSDALSSPSSIIVFIK